MVFVSGFGFSIMLDDDGDLWIAGHPETPLRGEIGYHLLEAHQIPCILPVLSVACGIIHCVFVDSSGNVYTFGRNMENYHNLGVGGTSVSSSIPCKLDLCDIISVHSMIFHTFCIDKHHRVWGFGKNQCGELGSYEMVHHLPTLIPGLEEITTAACGSTHSLFLTFDGDVFVCGDNRNYQLGIKGVNEIRTPQKNPELSNIIDIACGTTHSCVLSGDGSLFTFGNNTNGRLGIGKSSEKELICKVTLPWNEPDIRIKSIKCTISSTCILNNRGEIYCFGAGENYRLGLGVDIKEALSPQLVDIPEYIEYIGAGPHSITAISSKNAWVFGNNPREKLGKLPSAIPIPTKSPELFPHIAIPRDYRNIKSARK